MYSIKKSTESEFYFSNDKFKEYLDIYPLSQDMTLLNFKFKYDIQYEVKIITW